MKDRCKKWFHGVQCRLGWHGDYAVRQALCATTTDLVCTRCTKVTAIPVVVDDAPPVYTSLAVEDGLVKLTISDGRRELLKIKYAKAMAIQMGREFITHAEKLARVVHLHQDKPRRKTIEVMPHSAA